jgi:hypothetical protein
MAEYRYAYDEAVPGVLRAAAAVDCDIRVLLFDPGFPGVDGIDAAEGTPAGVLANESACPWHVRPDGERGRP